VNASLEDYENLLGEAQEIGSDVRIEVLRQLQTIPEGVVLREIQMFGQSKNASGLLVILENPSSTATHWSAVCEGLNLWSKEIKGLLTWFSSGGKNERNPYGQILRMGIFRGYLKPGMSLYKTLVEIGSSEELKNEGWFQDLIGNTPGLSARDITDWSVRNGSRAGVSQKYVAGIVCGQIHAPLSLLQAAIRGTSSYGRAGGCAVDLVEEIEPSLKKSGRFLQWEKSWTQFFVMNQPEERAELRGHLLLMAWRNTPVGTWPNRPFCRRVLMKWVEQKGLSSMISAATGQIPNEVWPWLGREIIAEWMKCPNLAREQRVALIQWLGQTTERPASVIPARRVSQKDTSIESSPAVLSSKILQKKTRLAR